MNAFVLPQSLGKPLSMSAGSFILLLIFVLGVVSTAVLLGDDRQDVTTLKSGLGPEVTAQSL